MTLRILDEILKILSDKKAHNFEVIRKEVGVSKESFGKIVRSMEEIGLLERREEKKNNYLIITEFGEESVSTI